jgi:hypothetical protein
MMCGVSASGRIMDPLPITIMCFSYQAWMLGSEI